MKTCVHIVEFFLEWEMFQTKVLENNNNNNNNIDINSQLDAKIIILLIISISSTCFGRTFRPSSGALDCVYSLCQQAASSVHYTTSCKHSLVLLRMGEIIDRNMLNWIKLLLKLILLHLVGCLYYCTNDARPHKNHILQNIKAHFMFNKFFPENRAVYEIMWKTMVEPERPHTLWIMRIACRIT